MIVWVILGVIPAVAAFSQEIEGFPGRSDHIINVDGVDRQFIVYQPAGLYSLPMPVVFMFHGTGGNGEKFYNISGWKEKADKEGLIAVFPSALTYCIEENGRKRNTTKWNEGKLDGYACPGQVHYDDVLFFREMVRFLQKNYPVDAGRIYASGFSNGGNFVSRLTLEASDILAATSIMAGFLQDTSFRAVSLIPSCLAIGDENIAKKTGKLPPWGEEALETPVLYRRVMDMVDALELDSVYRYEGTDSLLCYVFKGEEPRNEFRFYLIRDLTHRYPNGKNHSMVIADLFWDFFRQYRKE